MPALDAADLSAIRALVAELVPAVVRPVTDVILTTAEAMAYTKHKSTSAFYRWCRRWRVPGRNNRYSRFALDAGLAREAAVRRGRISHRIATGPLVAAVAPYCVPPQS